MQTRSQTKLEIANALVDLSDSNSDCESDFEEPEGDYCHGASKPTTVVRYTMAGGGAHWWLYEVHFTESGYAYKEQSEVYIVNEQGRHLQSGMRLYSNDDYLMLETDDYYTRTGDSSWRQIELYE